MAVSDVRPDLVRRGLLLNYVTIGYNALEAVVSLAAGVIAGSVALVGFGVDSCIELTSSAAAQWRLRRDHSVGQRERVERQSHRIIGSAFLLLAAFVLVDGGRTLLTREAPHPSSVGLAILAASVVVMPALARAKRKVARAMESRALESDANQASLCAYLSLIALVGVALNAAFGWWWADPVCALAMVPIIVREGWEGVRGVKHPDCC
ncbi:MAG TPA: cation transporter [Gemmatimonadaceae bacterium]|jgi:divalent metal cation (Fe/Co/Zn/Cd) transporter|nr:cation transporter [Gemmatimonadaceae bacterium]